MNITQKMKLDITPGGHRQVLHVSQYDVGREIIIQLMHGFREYEPDQNMSVEIEGTRPDGEGFQQNATLDGNSVSFPITAQMTDVAGNVVADVVLYDNTTQERVAAANFFFAVEPASLNHATHVAESQIPFIVNAEVREYMEEIRNIATTAKNEAESATNFYVGSDGYLHMSW